MELGSHEYLIHSSLTLSHLYLLPDSPLGLVHGHLALHPDLLASSPTCLVTHQCLGSKSHNFPDSTNKYGGRQRR